MGKLISSFGILSLWLAGPASYRGKRRAAAGGVCGRGSPPGHRRMDGCDITWVMAANQIAGRKDFPASYEPSNAVTSRYLGVGAIMNKHRHSMRKLSR